MLRRPQARILPHRRQPPRHPRRRIRCLIDRRRWITLAKRRQVRPLQPLMSLQRRRRQRRLPTRRLAPAAKSGLVDLNAPPQTHKMIDGDTLPKLSQQYYGRTDRYMEIFDFNRDVLQSPDVLPIGAELRIPSGLALPAGQDGTAKDVAASPTATSSAAGRAFGAFDYPSANTGLPRRKPLTYTVKKGDNLVDLAQVLRRRSTSHRFVRGKPRCDAQPGRSETGHGADRAVDQDARRCIMGTGLSSLASTADLCGRSRRCPA